MIGIEEKRVRHLRGRAHDFKLYQRELLWRGVTELKVVENLRPTSRMKIVKLEVV